MRGSTSTSSRATAWRTAEGHVGVLLANLAASPQRVTVPLADARDLVSGVVTAELDGLRTFLGHGGALPEAVEIDVPSWGVALVEVRPAGWRRPAPLRPAAPPAVASRP